MSDAPKVLILYPQVPFVTGGTEKVAAALNERFRSRGINSDVLTIPYRWDPKEEVIKELLLWRMLNLEADLVIPMKFPAYFVKHPNKVVWVQHQFRQIYEFHGTPLSGFSNNVPDGELREKLVEFDVKCLAGARAIYTNSKNTLSRLQKFNGLDGEVLYPPPLNEITGAEPEFGDYILAVGRLEESKRFDLLIRAVAETRNDVKVRIAGIGSQLDNLNELAKELNVNDRVDFLGYVSDEELTSLYNGCCAVHFAPYDEDYGLIAVEAMKASKPVITSEDSGGPLEHVEDRVNGIIMPPESEYQARALDSLWEDRAYCRELGEKGAEDVSRISWDNVVSELMKWL